MNLTRIILGTWLAAATCLLLAPVRHLAAAGGTELAAAQGGACEVCKSHVGDCTVATSCTKITEGANKDKFEQKSGSNITPMSCVAAAKGADGFEKCNLTDKKACFIFKICTDKNPQTGDCNNCSDKPGVPADNDKPTSCNNAGGYECKGA
jgi:hypothetical protein